MGGLEIPALIDLNCAELNSYLPLCNAGDPSPCFALQFGAMVSRAGSV